MGGAAGRVRRVPEGAAKRSKGSRSGQPGRVQAAGPGTGRAARAQTADRVQTAAFDLGLTAARPPAVALGRAVQPMVEIGRPGDPFEREADRVARSVASGGKAPAISRIGPEGLRTKLKGLDDEDPVAAMAGDERAQAATDEEEEPVQAAMEDEEPVQAAGEEEEEPVQASGEAGPAAIASRAIASSGPGRPLHPAVRSRLEPAFGADLSHVRVHDSPADRDAASGINARAFTHGSDIWLGHGESDSDVHLMAHEVTHVFQQGAAERGAVQRSPAGRAGPNGALEQRQGAARTGGPGRAVIQRQGNAGGEGGGGASGAGAPGTGGTGAGQAEDVPAMSEETGVVQGDDIIFSRIEVPDFKVSGHRAAIYRRDLIRSKEYTEASRKDTRQRDVWKRDVGNLAVGPIQQALEAKYRAAHGNLPTNEPYVFKAPSRFGKDKPLYFIGDLPKIARELTLPQWDEDGEPRSYDVDHILELQIANWPTDKSWANTIDNMELLDSGVNRSSGNAVKDSIEEKVEAFIRATHGRFGNDVAAIKRTYNLKFRQAVGGAESRQPGENDFWTKEEIIAGEHLDAVEPANLADVGQDGKVHVFPTEGGAGLGKGFKLEGAEGAKAAPADRGEANWLRPFEIKSKTFTTGGENISPGTPLGTFEVNVPENNRIWESFEQDKPVTVRRWQGTRYAGYVEKRDVLDELRDMRVKRLSPIRVDAFEIGPDGGLYAAGAILPDVPLIRDADLQFELEGSDFSVFKEFRTGEFNVPPPFIVSDSSLTIALSTERGLVVEGQIDFAIQRVGEGYLRAAANARGNFELEGTFNFDTDLFEQASIDLWYRNDEFGARGTLVIGRGKVRGIRSGRITAQYAGGQFSAEGQVEPDIPGIRQGRMTVSFSEEEGLVIGGGFDLSDDIPGIRGGSVDVTMRKQEDAWNVSARGTAQPDIPGVDATLSVSYDDGLFTILGSAEYRRGMLSGRIEVGVTNRPVDENGEPSGEPGSRLRAFGGGSVTIQVAPWLAGTVGVRLLENGEIEVSGRVSFPDTLEIFPGYRYDKELFRTPPIDIPIIGVSAAGQRIGIFATIRGGLEAKAGIGPGELQDVSLGITYNPDHEDQTHVTGTARLHVPADAGLRLYVQGGIGAGIPVVSATAGLEVGGELGLEGALDVNVNVDWTPATGLAINAVGEIFVQPKFRFNIEAFVNVELNVLFGSITLYENSWELAAFEYGSNLRFGLRFPVNYQEGEPFDISLSDVEFIAPDIDVKQLISDLVKEVV